MTTHPNHDSFEVVDGGIGSDLSDMPEEVDEPVIAFVIWASDIARCPDHNMSVEHWREDRTCQHEDPA